MHFIQASSKPISNPVEVKSPVTLKQFKKKDIFSKIVFFITLVFSKKITGKMYEFNKG